MYGQTTTNPPIAPPATLSTRQFPRRVRMLLEGIFEIVTGEMDRLLSSTLDGLEQQLFKQAEQARNNELQVRCLEALGTVKRSRFDLTPRYVALFESGLASIKDPKSAPVPEPVSFNELRLVAEDEMDETTLLREISSRADMRSSLPLFLLSQRFGVLTGLPAFDSEAMPLGPSALCQHLRRASRCLELGTDTRQLLFRQFDRVVMGDYNRLVEVVNAYLINQGVLPHLSYLPTRFKARRDNKDSTEPDAVESETSPATSRAPLPKPSTTKSSAQTGWPGESFRARNGAERSSNSDSGKNDIYTNLREMLHAARPAPAPASPHRGPGAVASQVDVQSVLSLLQRKPVSHAIVNGKPVARSIQHVKQDLLSQLRQISQGDAAPTLADQDTDTIELIGMLFDQLMKDVRPNSAAASLLQKLQVPLLRVALRDKEFFSHEEHPARQMLDAVTETGAYWAGEEGPDQELIGKVDQLVDRISSEFDGDVGLFNNLLGDLSQQTQSVMRKAEVAERRHVEASLGREKLTIAQTHAGEIMDEITRAHDVPKFTRALLTQAWTDVLALTALRHGENSKQWLQQIDVAKRIAAIAAGNQPKSGEDRSTLSEHIEHSLKQVGYHADEAIAIGKRLTASESDEDQPASRTELAMRLKARVRLGESVGSKTPVEVALPPMVPRELECLERIKALPFGTWLEFVTNQQGDRVRRRLSWFSPTTGNCLVVNHRGQRAGEYNLDVLARSMARDQLFVIQRQKEGFIDRAINAIKDRLSASRVVTHDGRPI